MKFRHIIYVLLLVLGTFPALAQEAVESLATHVSIRQYPGSDLNADNPGGPRAPRSEFILYHSQYGGNVPDGPFGETNATGTVYVHNPAEFEGYDRSIRQYEMLETILSERPDLANVEVVQLHGETGLPLLPIINGWQVLHAQEQYIETPTMSGIRYITTYTISGDPLNGSSFFYTFQGMTADGHVVSAIFELRTELFLPTSSEGVELIPNLPNSIATLNAATPDDFSPSLAELDALVQTLTYQPILLAQRSEFDLSQSGDFLVNVW
jgi:hypothetical protein